VSKSKSARAVLEKMNGGPLTFAQLVRAVRETDEVSQEELAKKLKIGKSFVSDVENGRRVPSIEKAAEWAVVLGYPFDSFIEAAVRSMVAEADLPAAVNVSITAA